MKLKINDLEKNEINSQLAAVQALTAQIVERDQAVQALTAQIVERDQAVKALNAQVAEREQEILMYALSKSWRITRPLRKITKILKGKRNA